MTARTFTDSELDAWFSETVTLAAAPGEVGRMPSNGDVAVARAIPTGPKVDVAIKELRALKQRFGGQIDPGTMDEKDLEAYLNEIKYKPSVGVTTVATVSLRKSGWSPQPGSTKNIPEKFVTYLGILAKAPCMEVIESNDETVSYREKNYNDLIDKAIKLLQLGIDGETDIDKIRNSLTSLAQGLTTSVKKTNSICILSQHAVALEPATPGYSVFLTQATMTLNKDGKAEVYESSLTVYWLKLRFNAEMWSSGMYRRIGKKAYADIDDFFDDIETPVPDSAPKLCFEA